MFELIAVLFLAAACIWAVVSPFVRPQALAQTGARRESTATEAAKESKYREIRDAENDYRAGKLSEQEWHAVDADLRAEATEILEQGDGPAPAQP